MAYLDLAQKRERRRLAAYISATQIATSQSPRHIKERIKTLLKGAE